MMNFPGVMSGDEEVLKKIEIARKLGKKIDGHAPGLEGKELVKYISKGISTDHECTTLKEAKEKILLGMNILIREGSAARNLESLKELINTNPERIMLCSDDLHPETLEKRHINKIVATLISSGFDIYDVIRSATINPSVHYDLDSGLLQPGQKADFIVVDSLQKMNVLETWINGRKVFEKGNVLFKYKPGKILNKFICQPIAIESIAIKNRGGKYRIIEAFDSELRTKSVIMASGTEKILGPEPGMDILKIVVKDRYEDKPPAVGFIKGFGLKHGAFASSVAHDSHNIISIGTNDKDMVSAINEIIRLKGGLAVSNGKEMKSLQLNVAGIMSNRSCNDIAFEYERLTGMVKKLGSTMSAPFMTLSFMALLVIPELKLSDRGLFDGTKFCHVPLFVE
jgi:adenine deaminase